MGSGLGGGVTRVVERGCWWGRTIVGVNDRAHGYRPTPARRFGGKEWGCAATLSGFVVGGSPPLPHHGYRIGVRYDGWGAVRRMGVGLLAVVRGGGGECVPARAPGYRPTPARRGLWW